VCRARVAGPRRRPPARGRDRKPRRPDRRRLRADARPGFDRRAAITPDRIPDPAIEAAVGPGEAVPLKKAFDLPPDRAEAVAERAAEVGYLERERRDGRPIVRATARYPDDWVGSLTAIENKPDLGTPGDLAAQLRYDAALGLFDEVVLATASYVTRARISIGSPRRSASGGSIPTRASARSFGSRRPSKPDAPGVEIREERALQTDGCGSSTPAKARKRRRIAERAYGKGWRPDPRAARTRRRLLTGARTAIGSIGSSIPGATAVRPVARTSLRIPRNRPGPLRDERTAWVADPTGDGPRRQSGLSRFL